MFILFVVFIFTLEENKISQDVHIYAIKVTNLFVLLSRCYSPYLDRGFMHQFGSDEDILQRISNVK